MLAYALTVFLGAFLLFQIQPLMGKSILPWFGGAPAVWSTCLVFFQLVLLAGYLYAHGLARRAAGTRPRVGIVDPSRLGLEASRSGRAHPAHPSYSDDERRFAVPASL